MSNFQIAYQQIHDLNQKHRNLILQAPTDDYLSLKGTISITCNHTIYNIPLNLTIQKTFPYQPPILTIPQTPNMAIRQTKYVDLQGKVYHPLLTYWNQQTTLLHLLDQIQLVFSMESPVYSTQTLPKSTTSNLNSVSQQQQQNASLQQIRLQQNQTPPKPPPKEISELKMKENLILKLNTKLVENLKLTLDVIPKQIDQNMSNKNIILKNRVNLENLEKNLVYHQNEITKTIKTLNNSKETMSEEIKQLNSKPNIEVSEIIVGLNPIDEQLYELMAEDLAIDDTLYVLDKSLQMGLCDLSQFLKNLRDLGRKQFKTRSLIKLIKNQKSLGT